MCTHFPGHFCPSSASHTRRRWCKLSTAYGQDCPSGQPFQMHNHRTQLVQALTCRSAGRREALSSTRSHAAIQSRCVHRVSGSATRSTRTIATISATISCVQGPFHRLQVWISTLSSKDCHLCKVLQTIVRPVSLLCELWLFVGIQL